MNAERIEELREWLTTVEDEQGDLWGPFDALAHDDLLSLLEEKEKQIKAGEGEERAAPLRSGKTGIANLNTSPSPGLSEADERAEWKAITLIVLRDIKTVLAREKRWAFVEAIGSAIELLSATPSPPEGD